MTIPIIFGSSVYDHTNWTLNGIQDSPLEPGEAEWRVNSEGKVIILAFVCPCGCRDVVPIPVQQGAGNSWNWDGDLVKPTLTPSILRMSGCKWHGYLTNGEFVSC